MSTPKSVQPATALRRFGLGARPGEMKRIAADPQGYVLQALASPQAAQIDSPDLEPSHITLASLQVLGQQKKLADTVKRERALELAQASVTDKANGELMREAPPAAAGAKGEPQLKPGRVRRDVFQEEASQRFAHQIATDAPFLERLVMFWSNHFCVASNKGNVRGLAGAFEREAIRPHVLGRFADMLLAVEQHPAMLIYLDNQISIGPNSQAGRNRQKGLNENLAREILELHTLGVGGGYAQADVTNFARIITGWSIGNLNQPQGVPGKFFFFPPRHEPGTWSVAGKTYADEGRKSGEKVLADLARHPATAHHIAVKLARHFVSDHAPAALVARLEKSFRESDGDLAALARTLATSEEAWAEPAHKIVPPTDFLVALSRGFGLPTKAPELLRLSLSLGQPLWTPPSPKGWPDDDHAWLAPSAIRERLRIAQQAARQADRLSDPRGLAEDLLGPVLGSETRQTIARAETREQGFELMIMSPEFLRR